MSADLQGRILAALAQATPQTPLDLVQLSGRLAGPLEEMERIQAALDDLVARHAVNTARVGTDPDALRPVYWPTCAMPAAVPYRDLVIKSHTRADAARAVGEKTAVSDLPTPTPTHQPEKEPATMARLNSPGYAARILAHLEAHGPTDSVDLRRAAQIGNDLDRYIVNQLASGEIVTRPNPRRGAGGYLVKAYMLAGQAEAWDAEHSGQADAPENHAPAQPAPRRACDPDAVSFSAGPEKPGVAFALWDDGELMLISGDDMIRLAVEDVRRLDRMLEHAQDIIHGEAA